MYDTDGGILVADAFVVYTVHISERCDGGQMLHTRIPGKLLKAQGFDENSVDRGADLFYFGELELSIRE